MKPHEEGAIEAGTDIDHGPPQKVDPEAEMQLKNSTPRSTPRRLTPRISTPRSNAVFPGENEKPQQATSRNFLKIEHEKDTSNKEMVYSIGLPTPLASTTHNTEQRNKNLIINMSASPKKKHAQHHRLRKHLRKEWSIAKKYHQKDDSSSSPSDDKKKFRPSVQLQIRRNSQRFIKYSSFFMRFMMNLSAEMSPQQLLAFVLVMVGILSECTVPAPRYNVPIGILILTSTTSKFDHKLMVAGLWLMILLDFFWLLRPQEAAFNGYFDKKIELFTELCLVICVMIKVWLVFSTYFELGPEPDENIAGKSKDDDTEESKAWKRFKYFFPRKTLPRRSFLSYEVLMRCLALIWIHGVCGIILLGLGIVSASLYSGKTQFRHVSFGIPLHLMMIFKGLTSLVTFFFASSKMNYYGCLKLSGCDRLAEYDESNAGEIILKYGAKWATNVQRAKMVDAITGFYMLFVLYSSFHSGPLYSGAVTIILILTAIALLIIDFWTPVLIMVVVRCGSILQMHYKRGTPDTDPYFPNQLEWEHESDGLDSSSGSEQEYAANDGVSNKSSSCTENEKKDSRRENYQSYSHRDSNHHLPTTSIRKQAAKKKGSILILDSTVDSKTIDLISSNGEAVWMRYWDETHRPYLVHSATGESVWEMMGDGAPPPTTSSSGITPGFSSSEGGIEIHAPGMQESHELSEHETGLEINQQIKSELSSEDFHVFWNELDDKGDFICRITRIPSVADLSRHLSQNSFFIAFDGLNAANLRTVHFYAPLPDVDHVSFFLGEFVFDSLSLKLFARFRCEDSDAIVRYVKMLRLKDVVGSYTACE